jgi:hypothetical protein
MFVSFVVGIKNSNQTIANEASRNSPYDVPTLPWTSLSVYSFGIYLVLVGALCVACLSQRSCEESDDK